MMDQTIDILLKERHYQLVVLLNVYKEKIVIPSGGSIKAKSDNSSGNADVIVSLLTDVA